MKKNKSAFSILIAMGLVLVMSLLVLYILEYMIPYSKNVKGIENSSNAFYQAENSIEDALKKFKDRGDSNFNDYSKNFSSKPIDYAFNTVSSGSEIPYNGDGNSEFDSTFNTISQGNPIQLKIGNGIKIDWDNSNNEIYFKVPDLDKSKIPNINETLSGGNLAIINWQLTTNSNNKTLNASGSFIKANEICKGNGTCNKIRLDNREGINLYGTGFTFNQFYEDNCEGTNSGCTLKMSVINKLELTNGTSIPYLEYKFKLKSDKKIPLRYSRIKSEGKSYGFQKFLELKIPQKTTNEAFDFTVFQ